MDHEKDLSSRILDYLSQQTMTGSVNHFYEYYPKIFHTTSERLKNALDSMIKNKLIVLMLFNDNTIVIYHSNSPVRRTAIDPREAIIRMSIAKEKKYMERDEKRVYRERKDRRGYSTMKQLEKNEVRARYGKSAPFPGRRKPSEIDYY